MFAADIQFLPAASTALVLPPYFPTEETKHVRRAGRDTPVVFVPIHPEIKHSRPLAAEWETAASVDAAPASSARSRGARMTQDAR